MEIDVERLIMEIKRHPAIWDIKSPEYTDRIQKVKQWEEVIDSFSVPGITDKNKKEKGRVLQVKWRNVRDTFMKECRKQALLKNGSVVPKTSQYKFYKQLSFLKDYAGKNDSQGSLCNDSENSMNNDMQTNMSGVVEVETAEESDAEMPPSPKRCKNNSHSEDINRELVHVLNFLKQKEPANEDPDRLFMLSLVPDLKKVPDRLKSALKLNLLKCIIEAQDGTFTCHTATSEQYLNHVDPSRSNFSNITPETTQGTASIKSEEDNPETSINEYDVPFFN